MNKRSLDQFHSICEFSKILLTGGYFGISDNIVHQMNEVQLHRIDRKLMELQPRLVI